MARAIKDADPVVDHAQDRRPPIGRGEQRRRELHLRREQLELHLEHWQQLVTRNLGRVNVLAQKVERRLHDARQAVSDDVVGVLDVCLDRILVEILHSRIFRE